MTRMMNKILCDAVEYAESGRGGYVVLQSHYDRYHGVRKMVNRLVESDLVTTATSEEQMMILVPTAHAVAMVREQA